MEDTRVESLYSVGASTWKRFLNGAPYLAPNLSSLLDDLSDSIGGSNMASVDCGDIAYVAMPAPMVTDYAGRTLVLKLHNRYDAGQMEWRVVNYGSIAAIGAEDVPTNLAGALFYIIPMFAEGGEDGENDE